ncbi:MAG: glycosyltransferase [Candidatus Competibacteraceae bacterium]|nr:MAG: glycosyltransferase [Candidatus Competibacteraceae bacterium]
MTTSLESSVVDIIIPVYRGLDETRRCLESVLAFQQQTTCEVVIINDYSPEPDLTDFLRQQAETGALTLLENPTNTGFVNTVNRGMMLHSDRDVVLLNSDTQVHGDWLDRLRRCAYSDPQIGTATPFSNNATICSYPHFCEDNLFFPTENRLAELDILFAEINAGLHVEIPTAVGFCMYITRRCIERVGYFDAQRFGRGYGEENDFCLRGNEIGFKHLLCGDVFVYHCGAVSFGPEHPFLARHAVEQLNVLYPSYDQLIASHVAMDPARLLRRRIDWARITRVSRPRLLFVTHQLGGGTEKHVRDLAYMLESQFEVLILNPNAGDKITLEWAKRGEEFRLYFAMPMAFEGLVGLLQKAAIIRIHFHHLIGHHPLIATLPHKLGIPYDYTLHDYFPICPQFNLTLPDGRYCGEPNVDGCNACLKERPPHWRLDIIAWRDYFYKFLMDAERIIGPSWDVINRIKKYIPEANYKYLPHPEIRTAKILVLGMMSPAKGIFQLESCVRDAKKRSLPLFFRVLGFPYYEKLPIDAVNSSNKNMPISFSGPYTDSDLSALVVSEHADIIYFPAQWPETYSYTLSAALRSKLPIVAPKLGAFIERLKDYPDAYLVEWDVSPQIVNDLLLDIMAGRQSVAERSKLGFGAVNCDAYLERYTDFMSRSISVNMLSQLTPNELKAEYVYQEWTGSVVDNLGRSQLIDIIKNLVGLPVGGILTKLEIETWWNVHLARQETLLAQLADKKRILADKEQALADKEQALADKEQALVQLNQRLVKQQQEIEHGRQYIEMLRQKAGEFEKIIKEIYSSTSWRLTRPVRWLGQWRQRF